MTYPSSSPNVAVCQALCFSAFRTRPRRTYAFTLIELLVVISIILILMGLLFPAFRGVQDQAKKTQAKNDLMQIVNAVTACYTEYGQYPCGSQGGGDANDFFGGDDAAQAKLFTDLRGISGMSDAAVNPRMVVFMNLPVAKDVNNPKSGIGSNGRYYDPWGSPYRV